MMQVLSILPVDFILADEVKRICSLFQNELKMFAAIKLFYTIAHELTPQTGKRSLSAWN